MLDYNGWDNFLFQEISKKYYNNLQKFLDEEYKTKKIFPKREDTLNALWNVSPEDVKVVILGQDCYHDDNQAMGLAFSVNDGVKIPPSLMNIYKEIKNDLDIEIPKSGNLTRWAKQGVFLLNSCLTVEAHKPASHAGKGWETFTDNIIKYLNETGSPKVFMLWGSYARSKKQFITNKTHLILESSHPSPLSVYRGFMGCKHFSKANEFLIKNYGKKIEW